MDLERGVHVNLASMNRTDAGAHSFPRAPQPANPVVPWTVGDMVKALLALLAGMLVANIAAVVIADSLLDAGQAYEDNAAAFAVILIPSMIIVELFFLAVAFWFGPRKYKLGIAALGLRSPVRGAAWLPLALALVGLGIVYGYDGLMSLLGVSGDASPDEVFENAGPFLVVAVGAIVLAPVVEEVFFRGFVFGGINTRHGLMVATLVSSLAFSVAHLSVYGLLPYAAIGALFAGAYAYSGSLKATVVAHCLINVVTVGVAWLTSGVL
jgi:membrane protease YdiL (CAAX protease family)